MIVGVEQEILDEMKSSGKPLEAVVADLDKLVATLEAGLKEAKKQAGFRPSDHDLHMREVRAKIALDDAKHRRSIAKFALSEQH